MAQPQSPTTPTDFDSFPSLLARSATAPTGFVPQRPDRSRLAPEDAFYAPSPPRFRPGAGGAVSGAGGNGPATGPAGAGIVDVRSRRLRLDDEGSRSRSRRRKRTWKKLLWVKQSSKFPALLAAQLARHLLRAGARIGGKDSQAFSWLTSSADPDNYTDRATFLENLQRNPRLQPYDFWPLVADSTVIVQHVCSVIIFVVCFVGIFQERVSPVTVVSCGSLATCLGWLIWERWVADEEADGGTEGEDGSGRPSGGGAHPGLGQRPASAGVGAAGAGAGLGRRGSNSRRTSSLRRPPARLRHDDSNASTAPSAASSTSNLSLSNDRGGAKPASAATASGSSGAAIKSSSDESLPLSSPGPAPLASVATPPYPTNGSRSPQRLGTIKSAILIYSTLLSLSPILKSLTRSTSSDSIWSMSFWLLAINIFFFDYSGGVVDAKFPASLSTNAALMASTVLASRLPSTGQVFSLTLFSIEVFGLFPVFRRYARHRSWRYHAPLTVLLVLGAGCGVGMILGDSNGLPWRSGLVGMAVGVLIAVVAMGGCSWWLIGLQKYKNEISGPWDPARPIIISRRHWDDG